MSQMDVALDPLAGCANNLEMAKGLVRTLIRRRFPDEPVSILAVDPGPQLSGWCLYLPEMPAGRRVLAAGVDDNERLLARLRSTTYTRVAIEMIASYGMPVGREVFETCVWIGRYVETAGGMDRVELVYRKDVKMHLCGSMKAKDANIRQAIIDLFPGTGGGKTPQIGTKAKPGPLYGVSTHVWPALAVALTVAAQTTSRSDCTVLGE